MGKAVREDVGRFKGFGLGLLVVEVCVVPEPEDLSKSGTISATLGTGDCDLLPGEGLTSRDLDGGGPGLGSRDLG